MRTSTDRLLMLANRLLLRKPDYSKLYEEYRLQYYQDHREELVEYARTYYRENREKCIETVREWQRNNAEKVKADRRKWRKDNKEYCQEEVQKWRKEHPIGNKGFSWKYNDKKTQILREKAIEYARLHPDIKLETAKKYRDANKARIKIIAESNRLLAKGLIKKTACKCGKEGIMMYHLDYIDPANIEWCCKECFWLKTKERNRQIKLAKLKGI